MNAKVQSSLRPDAIDAVRSHFYETIRADGLTPLWTVMGNFVTPEPRSPVKPALWKYEVVRKHLLRAGDLITAEEAERRVLILENPGLPGSSLITRSLYAGFQLVRPSEVAACHRHTQSALRFIVEGAGAYTAVNGERAVMQPFDLVLTPNMQWHDHGNDTDRDIIWLDGLDIGVVQLFDASFSARLPEPVHKETRSAGDTLRRFGQNLRPLTGAHAQKYPLFHYPYSAWRETLRIMQSTDPADSAYGYKAEFINPVDGGAALPTISAFVQLIPAGMTTSSVRFTDGAIYTVVEGSGVVLVGHDQLRVGPRDVFVVPSWQPVSIEASAELVLFNYSDRAAQIKLGLWNEQRS
jgi:gentisate 1,2-dioxygenase